MSRPRTVRAAIALTLAAAPLTAAAAAADTAQCIPSVSGKGPTIHIVPDYSDPTQSDVYYESNGIEVRADLCLG